jgi:hypothetical protein
LQQRVEHRGRGLEIADGLEERHDVEVECGLGPHAQEPRLLEQQQRLEHVARRARLRDDVVRDRARAEARTDFVRGAQHRELAPRDLAVARFRHREPPRPGQLARQELDARGLVQPLVVRRDLRRREQLGDDRLLDRGALAQVEARGGTRTRPPRARALDRRGRDRPGAVPAQRRVDDAQVGGELAGAAYGSASSPAAPAPHVWRARGRGEARVDADERLPVRLVLPERRRIGGAPREAARSALGVTSRDDSDSSCPSRCTAAR